MKNLIKPLGFLAILILFCAVASRLLNSGETLAEYAQSHPDKAYASPSVQTTSPSGGSEASLSDEAPSSVSFDENGKEQTEQTASVSFDESGKEQKAPAPEDPRSCFYYEPLSEELIDRITGISYPQSEEELQISYEDLRYLKVLYHDFNGEIQSGELICNKGIAKDLLDIFYELYMNEYQIEKIRLIDEYNGDDTASMLDNNTSCFNYRVVDGSDHLSKHAFGCAIDINPFYNPYVVFEKDGSGETYISPEGSEIYADRSRDFSYKIDENDLCYKLFKEHGFVWGGDWNSCKDYQHFQKTVN